MVAFVWLPIILVFFLFRCSLVFVCAHSATAFRQCGCGVRQCVLNFISLFIFNFHFCFVFVVLNDMRFVEYHHHHSTNGGSLLHIVIN